MSAPRLHDVDAFLALLRSQPGPMAAAKAEAFRRLVDAFPHPEGPQEWALRQILRGQFDRRLPAPWRPIFVEVFHQWLGFRAESEAERDRRPSSFAWWVRPLPRSLRRHGWGGAPFTPLALLAALVLAAWSLLAAGWETRRDAVRQSDLALRRLAATDPSARERELQELLHDGGDDALIRALALSSELRLAHGIHDAQREASLKDLGAAERRAATWWDLPSAIRPR